MKCGMKMYISLFWIALGAVLTVCGHMGWLDAFWSGMGGAFVVIGVLRAVRIRRYQKNEAYREKVDIENKDERNRFIATKAWSWAGYMYVIIAAIATIALKIAGLDDFSMLVSGSMCLILVLYWVSFAVIKRKY